MAAAYETGTATGPTDLLNKIATFLSGQGWTIDLNELAQVPASTGSLYFSLAEIELGPNAIAETISITYASSTTVSVDGSISGHLGTATVGTQFHDAGGHIRFKIPAATTIFPGYVDQVVSVTPTGRRLHVSKSGFHVHLRACQGETGDSFNAHNFWPSQYNASIAFNGVHLYASSGVDTDRIWINAGAASTPPVQNGAPSSILGASAVFTGAITSYNFFEDGAGNFIAVIEKTPGVFVHLGFGVSLTKSGSYTGGCYFFATTSSEYATSDGTNTGAGFTTTADAPMSRQASNFQNNGSSAFVRADVDSFTGQWMGTGTTFVGAYGYTGKQAPAFDNNHVNRVSPVFADDTGLWSRLFSSSNQQIQLMPQLIFTYRDSGLVSLLGQVPQIFVTNATAHGVAAKAVLPIGSDNYMLFPNFAVKKLA